MCFFPYKNKVSMRARLKGVEEFECGHCPECLAKKSRMWALRTAMEARVSQGYMVTLTYDSYKNEQTLEENPINPNQELNKKHCQDFIKRLREHFRARGFDNVKYLLTAERGRKGRAHYHALLFGFFFDDLVFYKKSDRGNVIYKSLTLTNLWGKGICTVDCKNVNAQTARYCTKYCSKDSGAEETFMLFSRGIGDCELLRLFNGKSYWVDGREYPIPKGVWQQVIEKRYNICGFSKYKCLEKVEQAQKKVYNLLMRSDLDENRLERLESLRSKVQYHDNLLRKFRYQKMAKAKRDYTRFLYEQKANFHEDLRNKFGCMARKICDNYHSLEKDIDIIHERFVQSAVGYQRQAEKREIFQKFRDNDTQYKRYLSYWKRKGEIFKATQDPIYQRILNLPTQKYRAYKDQALKYIRQYVTSNIVVPVTHYELWYNPTLRINEFIPYVEYEKVKCIREGSPPRCNTQAYNTIKHHERKLEMSFAPLSRHYRANDRLKSSIKEKIKDFLVTCTRALLERNSEPLDFFEFAQVFNKNYKKS